MRNLRLWMWPGLAAVACLAALAIWFTAGAIEADLRARAVSALRQDDAWAQVLLSGRDLTLTGLAPDVASRSRALSAARNVHGVRIVRDASTLMPEEKPYRLFAEKTSSGVTLSGFVPNDAVRANIISGLTGMLPGIALSDQMNLARGAPDGLVDLAVFGLSAFSRFSTGTLEIVDRSVRISGQALNPDDHETVLASLSQVPPAGGVLEAVEITPAAVNGVYSWSAAVEAGTLLLSGHVPDATTRAAILERAKSIAPDLSVDDQMRFASGAPDDIDWLAATTEAMTALSKLSGGQASIRGKILDVSGDARDAEAFRRVQEELSTGLDSGLVLGTADIGMARVSPFEWVARRSDQGLALSGFVPSAAVRANILAASRLKFGTSEIKDKLKIAVGAPAGFEAAALTALQVLSRLDNAEVRILDGTVTATGTALNEIASKAVSRLMAEGLPDGFAGKPAIAPQRQAGAELPAASCQTGLNRLSGLNTVLFETGKAAIQDHSHGFLDRIAGVVQQCGELRLEISGHTDSDGTEADNLALSERRAEAVAEFMTAAGIAASRLVAIGYGESRPLQGNDTDAGKAANRRIEFRVLN